MGEKGPAGAVLDDFRFGEVTGGDDGVNFGQGDPAVIHRFLRLQDDAVRGLGGVVDKAIGKDLAVLNGGDLD